jgi:hypothetical protein
VGEVEPLNFKVRGSLSAVAPTGKPKAAAVASGTMPLAKPSAARIEPIIAPRMLASSRRRAGHLVRDDQVDVSQEGLRRALTARMRAAGCQTGWRRRTMGLLRS